MNLIRQIMLSWWLY